MKSFKEYLSSDMAVFINENEFGEIHSIDGKSVNIIIDDDKLAERQSGAFDGISLGTILYYVKTDVFEKPPIVGASQKFDGKFMIITSVISTDGMYEIMLSQNRGE